MKHYINRIEITDATTGDRWRVTHAANAENGNDFMHAQDYALSPAQAAALQAAGYITSDGETLISTVIDPLEVNRGR